MGWIDAITENMHPKLAQFVVALDPDRLLSEETVLATLRSRGYELLTHDDDVTFRLEFETKFRNQADAAIVVIHPGENKEEVPFDILSRATLVSLSLAHMFPNLSVPIVADLDRSDLVLLYDAQQKSKPSLSSDAETKSFILLHVFQIAPEVIRTPSDLLKALLGIHYSGREIPSIFSNWMADRLEQVVSLDGWPLRKLIGDRAAFLQFLQDRWPLFLSKTVGDTQFDNIELSLPGPADIPFDHHDVRIYIDNLFLEGSLTPVEFGLFDKLPKWMRVGVVGDQGDDNLSRLKRLLEKIGNEIPDTIARHREWTTFAYRWAEVSVLWNSLPIDGKRIIATDFQEIQIKIDENFGVWMAERYSGLHSQPPAPPVMVHHIPKVIARSIDESKGAKAALIVVDGLALDQWQILSHHFREFESDLTIHEDAVYAWVPTITSVSRQAIFSGKPPVQFARYLKSTYKEEALWRQFWADRGVTGRQVLYRKGLGDYADLTELETLLDQPHVRIVGLVVDKVDKMMHGAALGMAGLHNQVSLWARDGYFSDLCRYLVKWGFMVYITSDHGNVEASGVGRPSERAIAELRGERVRIYPNQELRRQIKEKFPTSTEWQPVGLPYDFLPLLAMGREAFVSNGETVVGHGGASLEEVVVPFIRIESTK